MNREFPSGNRYPRHAFRAWHGMLGSAWFRLLWRNRFAVSASRLDFALVVSFYSIINSALNFVQELAFADRIRGTEIDPSPIFIIGHWRTGTTLVHELLALDPRLTTPTTLDCFAPSNVLLTGWLLRKLPFLLPSARPMDPMPLNWDRPQEDEFALINLGYGSPYEMLAFPNRRFVGHPFLTLQGLAASEVAAWEAGLLRFMQQTALRAGRGEPTQRAARLVLKSPPHTARLRTLIHLFPNARFIHMVRDPVDIFASTMRLWQALCRTHGLQRPQFDAGANGVPSMRDYVLDSMNVLYRDFPAAIAEIPPRHFCEVKYEELVRAPMSELRRIYEQLELGWIDAVEDKFAAHLVEIANYMPNQHLVSDQDREKISAKWAWYFERYGYECPIPLDSVSPRTGLSAIETGELAET
jgi:hypothetical protein